MSLEDGQSNTRLCVLQPRMLSFGTVDLTLCSASPYFQLYTEGRWPQTLRALAGSGISRMAVPGPRLVFLYEVLSRKMDKNGTVSSQAEKLGPV